MLTIDSLPNEILSRILCDHLNIEELHISSQVCSRWRLQINYKVENVLVNFLTEFPDFTMHPHQLSISALTSFRSCLLNVRQNPCAGSQEKFELLSTAVKKLTINFFLNFPEVASQIEQISPGKGESNNLFTEKLYSQVMNYLKSETATQRITRLKFYNYPNVAVPGSIFHLKKIKLFELSESPNAYIQPIGMLANLTSLWLTQNKFDSLPKSVFQLTNLIDLTLSDNNLTKISKKIGNLVNLIDLDLSNNKLTKLPETIGKCADIGALNLRGNLLKGLPQTIGHCTNIERLYLQENQLESIPQTIRNCTSLQILSIQKNKLHYLPNSITSCVNLRQVDLTENLLTRLPQNFGNLNNITHLSVSCNLLKGLPKSFGSLAKMRWCFLNENHLRKLPDNIDGLKEVEWLGLSHNPIDTVPLTLTKLERLGWLYLDFEQKQKFQEPLKSIAHTFTLSENLKD